MKHPLTTSGYEWRQVTMSGTTTDNKWQRVVQQVTSSGKMSDNEWQRMVISANFLYLRIKSGTYH